MLAGSTANGVGNAPLAGFPTDGPTFAVMTTGESTVADQPNTSTSTTHSTGTWQVRGVDTVYDLSILKLDFVVPTAACLLKLTYRYLSEEYPEYVGSQYNDVFVAELDANTWTSTNGVLTAPAAFATASVNQTPMDPVNATGTTYDGAGLLNTAVTAVTQGAHTVYLSIGDLGDAAYDSAVFLDDLRLICDAGTPPDPPGHVTIHRFPTKTLLVVEPPGFFCVDANSNAEVDAGSELTEPNAGVRCVHPDPNFVCHSVSAGGYNGDVASESVTVRSACDGLSVEQPLYLPLNNPGLSTEVGYGTPPWVCATENQFVSNVADYWVFCHVNIP